jgi:O-antigen/teichoic acid export membrane protein
MIIKTKLESLLDKYKNGSLFFKASIWFVILSFFNHGASVLTQPFVNRILSVDEVGVYHIYNTWHNLLSIIATLNLFNGMYEVLLTKEKENKKQIIPSLLSVCLLVSAGVSIICIIFIKPLSVWWELKSEYIFVMVISVIAEAILQFWNIEKRFDYSYKAYSAMVGTITVSKCILTILLSVLFNGDRVLGRILGLTIPPVIFAVYVLWWAFKKAECRNLTKYWKRALFFNLPLVPHYVSSILLHSSDKIMIQKLCGEQGTYNAGLYGVAYSLASLMLVIFNALYKSYRPYALNAIKEKNYKSLQNKTDPLVFISIAFAVLVMLVAPEGLLILGGGKYISVKSLVPVLIVGVFFSTFYEIFSNVEFIYEKSKYIFPVTLLGAGVNILLNYFLIPIWGYKIAAYTSVLGYMIIAICHYILSYKIVGKNIFNIKNLGLAVCIFIGFATLSSLSYNLHWAVRYGAFLALLILGVFVYFFKFRRKTEKCTGELHTNEV